MKKIFGFITLLLIGIIIFGIVRIIENRTKKDIEIQIIKFDIMSDNEKIVKKAKLKDNDIINLEKYNGNNIKILEINSRGVKISRDALRYEIINQDSLYYGEVKEYIETVVEEVDCDTLINININSNNPFGPEYTKARYYYNIRFICPK